MIGFSWQFGHRIREIRKSIRMNQDEFGVSLGVSRQTINSYENNRQRPPLDMMRKVCEIHDVSPFWLLTGIGQIKAGSYPQLEEMMAPLGVSEDNLVPEQRALINYIMEDAKRAKLLARFLFDRGLGHPGS